MESISTVWTADCSFFTSPVTISLTSGALRHMAPVFRVAFLTSVNNRQILINPMFLVVGVTDKKREAFPEASQAPSMFDNFILYLLRHVCLSTYTGFWESGIASLGIAVQVVQEACSG